MHFEHCDQEEDEPECAEECKRNQDQNQNKREPFCTAEVSTIYVPLDEIEDDKRDDTESYP